MTGYEDVFYYLWKERKLPVNVDPLDPKIADPLERDRVAQVFEQGLGQPIGYVLPLRPHHDPFRGAGLDQPALVSGLDSRCFWFRAIPRWATDCRWNPFPGPNRKIRLYSYEPDPFAKRDSPSGKAGAQKTSVRRALRGGRAGAPPAPNLRRKANRRRGLPVPPSAWNPARASCYVFMPPVEHIRDYLDLVAAIEDTAAYLGMPVHVEGYTPPSDVRINVLKVTPDPGVIEVNIHPAASWDELSDQHHRRSTNSHARAVWAPKSSCWMDNTPGPAAEITSCWAGRLRKTARSCGVPICCAA